jgi:hypothetical protein
MSALNRPLFSPRQVVDIFLSLSGRRADSAAIPAAPGCVVAAPMLFLSEHCGRTRGKVKPARVDGIAPARYESYEVIN